MGENEKIGTSAGSRANTRLDTRTATATRAGRVREAFWVPDICQTTTGSTFYRDLIPPRPEALHQWRDLKNRIRHDYNLVPLPYKGEDIVKRWRYFRSAGSQCKDFKVLIVLTKRSRLICIFLNSIPCKYNVAVTIRYRNSQGSFCDVIA